MTFPSLYAFFRDGAFLGLILLIAFMCENFPLHAQGAKEWDRDMYWFLCLLLLVASLMTMRKVGGWVVVESSTAVGLSASLPALWEPIHRRFHHAAHAQRQ